MYFKRNGKLITASTKDEAIKIIASDKQEIVVANDDNIYDLVCEGIEKYGNKADLNYIDVSEVKYMSGLFSSKYRSKFNGDISKWNVSKVENMKTMFIDSKFNGDISKWNVGKVENMYGMFARSKFNKDISNWNVGKVKNMELMFFDSKFNKDISQWNVSNVENMKNMFYRSTLDKNPPKWFKE